MASAKFCKVRILFSLQTTLSKWVLKSAQLKWLLVDEKLLKVIKALILLDSRAKMRYGLEGQKELDQDVKVQF